MNANMIRTLLASFSIILLSGCISESNFRLSDESRLPRWFKLPEGKTREEVVVRLYYYSNPSGRTAKLIFEDRDGWLSIDKVAGEIRGSKPLQLESAAGDYDPEYEILSAEGITDIIGHKGSNDLFYMVDDPTVWEELGVESK
jgi:hypothetical protein